MNKVLIVILFLITITAKASSYKGIEYTIEPIYGQQKVGLQLPSKHTVWEHFYGARISGGYKVFNIEGMYTKTEVDTIYISNNEVTRDIVEKLSLGLSTSHPLNDWSLALLRVGVQAKRVEHHSIIAGTTKTTKGVDQYHPYLGMGFELYLKNYAAISLGANIIFNDISSDYTNNEYEYTSGIKILY